MNNPNDRNNFIAGRKKYWLSFAGTQGLDELAEVTALKEFEATHDTLTDLLIRRGVKESFNKGLDIAKRYKQVDNFENICIVLDLKGLKITNDRYGYDKGDELVKNAASIIKKCALRPLDIVGRLGGDEFIMLLLDTDIQGSDVVLTRITELSKMREIYFHIGRVMFNSSDNLETVITKTANMMEESKKTLKKDDSGRSLADSTTIINE